MKKWLKIISVIFLFALISIIAYLIIKSFGIANLKQIKEIIIESRYSILIYIIIQTILLIVLCFVPLLNTSLVILGIAIFGSKITFFSTLTAVFFSTTILFFIGDKIGEKFAAKLIGEKDLIETQNRIEHKSKFWLPIFFIIPGIPDEALCLVAGMTKMKYWYLLLVSILYHAIEIGIFCFLGSGFIVWSNLSLIDWFLLINVVSFDIYLLYRFEKYLDKKSKEK